MKLKTIITILLAVAALTVQAQTKVWDNIVMGYANAPIINVNRVALYADRTDVSLHIDYRKGRQMGFSRGTALKAGGKEYLQVHSFPTYKLIDRDGKVLDVNADPRDLESLAKLLDQMK